MTKFEAAANMVKLIDELPDEFDYSTIEESSRTTYTITHMASKVKIVFIKEDSRHGDVFTNSVDSSFHYVSVNSMERAAILADAYLAHCAERRDVREDNETLEIILGHIKQ